MRHRASSSLESIPAGTGRGLQGYPSLTPSTWRVIVAFACTRHVLTRSPRYSSMIWCTVWWSGGFLQRLLHQLSLSVGHCSPKCTRELAQCQLLRWPWALCPHARVYDRDPQETYSLGAWYPKSICLRQEKCYFLRKTQQRSYFVWEMVVLEHPRYIEQYKSKEKQLYIDKFITLLKTWLYENPKWIRRISLRRGHLRWSGWAYYVTHAQERVKELRPHIDYCLSLAP